MEFYSPAPLPEPVFKLLTSDEYDKQGDYSVTQLLQAPRQSILKERHLDKTSQNVMNRMFMVRGNMMHSAFSNVKTSGAIIEERFMINVLNKQISMKADYVWPYMEQNNKKHFEILDAKDPSHYVVNPGPGQQWYNKDSWTTRVDKHEDWIKQINCYAYGMRMRGFNVDAGKLVLFLRDWSYVEEQRSHGGKPYPPHEIAIVPIPMWSDAATLKFLESRVRIFEECRQLRDEELPECTRNERWADLDRYAVGTGSGSDARALPGGAKFETEGEAIIFNNERNSKKATKKKGRVTFRPAESKRCERGYCPISGYCNQFKEKISKDPF